MKSAASAPGDYVYFRSQVPLHRISSVPPLICIPGIAGTADVYYKQIMSLSMKGYRVVSVDIPRVWNHHEWIQAFEKFLDAINVHHVHLYGTSLGGFLAQIFAQHRPRRVKSLVLSNSFLDSKNFSAAMPWSPMIHDGPHEPFIADAVDFVVGQIETLSRDDLSSRLTLNAAPASVGSLLLSDSFVTLMDTNDYCAVPQPLKDQVGERYPGARRAILKSGGDFPFLSRPDEVNLYLQLHLRRVGVEPKPDLLQGAAPTVTPPAAPTMGRRAGTTPAALHQTVEDPELARKAQAHTSCRCRREVVLVITSSTMSRRGNHRRSVAAALALSLFIIRVAAPLKI
ncbi:unnamed protein product [Spirodela intermedia]|uniref:Maspardin n=1 Tax=Spirodela intermedia TaxID=51605 RepID=A0A7I8JVV9_SPIIN|nr:unnamed protein product [Spirodela intermedia]CAA6673592.1 unnamed protein product [Spirodela intermedia]